MAMVEVAKRRRQFCWKVLVAGCLVIIAGELGAIWLEVHHMRQEQVKNSLVSLPEDRRLSLRGTVRGKRLESTVKLEEPVEVKADEPIRVEVDR